MAQAFSKALGRKVVYHVMEPTAYRARLPRRGDLGNMFQFYRDFAEDFRAPRSVDKTRELNPEVASFSQWLDANGKKVPVA